MHKLLPPVLFVVVLAVSVVVGSFVPIAGPLVLALRLIGLAPIVAGLWLTVSSARHFERVGTNIVTFRDPTLLVVDGRFSWTRNPMYLGFVVMLAGAAVMVGTVSAWVGPLVFALVADRWYIRFEERRMVAAFGDAYLDYTRRVRRWVGRRRPSSGS